MKTKRQALVLVSSLLAVTVLAWMGLLWKGERQVYGMSDAAQGQASGVERTTTPSPAAMLRPTASLTTRPTVAEVFVPYQDYLNETHTPGWIIFAKDEDVNDEIPADYFIMDADGNHVRFLESGYGPNAVSHSGNWGAFASKFGVSLYDARAFMENRKWRPPENARFRTVRYLDGGYGFEEQNHYPLPISLAWSRDDRMLAVSMVERYTTFSKDWGNTNISSRVCLMRVNPGRDWEGQCREEAGKYVYRLSWGPDGKELLMSYLALKEKQAVVTRIDLEGRELERMEDAYSAVWSPVGASYAYYKGNAVDQNGLYIYDFEKKTGRRLVDGRGPVQPGNIYYTNQPLYMSWSPDGRYLAATTTILGEAKPITNDISRIDVQTGEIVWISQAFMGDLLFFPEWGE